ncbi:MAG: hypothetical protein HY907_20855 [Deltaproteobacteria bacterium]|nr:hypothetical protein [Deltaproteobacteria bacterium]
MRTPLAMAMVGLVGVSPAAGQPAPTPAAESTESLAPVVCVQGDDPAGVAELVAGLAARGMPAAPCPDDPGEAWVVAVQGLASGRISVEVRSPGTLSWRPEVDLDPAAGTAERARAAAVTAAALLRLVFDSHPSPALAVTPPAEPPPAEPAPTPPPVAETAPQTEPTAAAAEPDQPPERSAWTWVVGIAVGAEGDIGGSSARRGTGFDLGLRVEAIHEAGVWLTGQFDWTITWADRGETLLLETGTPRLLAGATLGTAVWAVRLGLGGAFQGWWTAGGTAPSGWRLGTALAASFRWQALSWLAVGGEAGVDVYRTRVEVDFGGEPVFGLDHWRWRAGAWLGGTFGS